MDCEINLIASCSVSHAGVNKPQHHLYNMHQPRNCFFGGGLQALDGFLTSTELKVSRESDFFHKFRLQ